MRKLTVVLITLAMILGLSVSAFAVGLGSNDRDVYVTVNPNGTQVWDVTLTWGTFEFIYTTGVWNGAAYESGHWTANSVITITNKSNNDIWYSAKYTETIDEGQRNNISFAFTGTGASGAVVNPTQLVSAVDHGSPTSGEFSFGPNDHPNVHEMARVKFGEISITIDNDNNLNNNT